MGMQPKKPFFDRVVAAVSRIPRGSTASYTDIATAAGSPHAYRAVGTIMANNRNPAVPCHRVIHADGSLGSYNRGGILRKKELLESEGVRVKKIKTGFVVERKILGPLISKGKEEE